MQYPDYDSGATRDYVLYAYNTLGERIAMEDQANNLIDTSYDTAGRVSARVVTNLASGFDGDVRQIEYTYDDFGRQSTVTQLDAVTSGSVVDQIKMTYDDWGPISKIEHDHNSTIATGGNYLYDLEYDYERADNDGRQTVRRDTMTLPSGNVITNVYYNALDRHDDELSRVTNQKDGGVSIVHHFYNGAATVVGVKYPEPDVNSVVYSGGNGRSFNDLDNFNRVIRSEWRKDLTTDIYFYDIDISYDANSNITLVEDQVHSGRDVAYSIDDLNRLYDAVYCSVIDNSSKLEINPESENVAMTM